MNNKFVAVLCLLGAYFLNASGGTSILPSIDKSPVPGSGLHVLIVEDRLHRRDLPPAQLDAMMSADVDELIRDAGGHKYLYDQNQDMSRKDDPWVLEAMKVPRKKLPWVVIDNNGNGASQELPANSEEFKSFVGGFIK